MYELAKAKLKLEFYRDYINIWKDKLEDYKTHKQKYIDLLKNDRIFDLIPKTQLDDYINKLVDNYIEDFEERIKSVEEEMKNSEGKLQGK